MYENRRTKPVEIVLRRGHGERENDRGDKSKIHFKHICKYHNVSPMLVNFGKQYLTKICEKLSNQDFEMS
jgi:hypothetical protein